MRHTRHLRVLVALAVLTIAAPAAAQVSSPETFFGFKMGADTKLADWPSIEKYFRAVDAASDRVQVVDVGPSTEGRRIIAAIISSPEHIRNLETLQIDNRLLSDPRRLANDREALAIRSGAVPVVAIGASIHSSEIGASQAANELLFDLATKNDPETQAVLANLIVILMPSLNPDGHTLVVDWYRKMLGTPFEGGQMPWMYHKYVGHDINRDAFMMNMEENRTIARFFTQQWHPQVFLAMHQMGPNGPRMFVPPNLDPIDPNQDPLIWRTAGLLGSAMALALEGENKAGVISNAMYDYYWPGYEDSAPLGRNTVCVLTEAASAKLASPIDVAAKDLQAGSRGVPADRPLINFPHPWSGGTWRLRDIVAYDLTAMKGLLGAAARYHDDLLLNFYNMGRHAIERGTTEKPFAFVIPPDQHDALALAKLVSLLAEGGVDVLQAQEPFKAGSTIYDAGAVIVPMAQPFRAYAKSLLEVQQYPTKPTAPGAAPERPYDVTGWTLPIQMGVKVDRIDEAFETPVASKIDRLVRPASYIVGHPKPSVYLIDARGNGGAIAANRLLSAGLEPEWTAGVVTTDGFTYQPGTLVVRASSTSKPVVEELGRRLGLRVAGAKMRLPATAVVNQPRVALYRPWSDAIDEGWTRWLLEQHAFGFTTLRSADVRKGALTSRFDVIVLPSESASRLIDGNKTGSVPDEYAGGLGKEGVESLAAFVQSGGTLVTLDASSQLAIDALKLPVKNAIKDLPADKFYCPGSLVRLDVDTTQPLGFGLMAKTAAYFGYSSAWDISSAPGARVIARYGAKDVLLSGWIQGEDAIAGQPAVVEVQAGAGRVVLIGFPAQHRGQSHATFRLLFNAILSSRPVGRKS
jgi:hypothetical protein